MEKIIKLFVFSVFIFTVVSCEKNEIYPNRELSNDDYLEENMVNENNNYVETNNIEEAFLRGWSKYGNCLSGYGNCAIAIVGSLNNDFQQGNPSPVSLSIKENNRLEVVFNTVRNNEDLDGKLYFNNDYELSRDLSNRLGLESILVLEGTYIIDYSDNELGVVTLDISTQ